MLYLTTRNSNDAYTAHRTLCSDHAPDGGAYIPLTLPEFTSDDILLLKDKGFGSIVAEILNCFFSAKLTGWDIDFAIGRNPVKLAPMSLKTVVAELWHCPDARFDSMICALYARLRSDNDCSDTPTEWVRITFRIAVLFALYGQLLSDCILNPGDVYDVAVCLNDFTSVTAAWYAKRMGLPISALICTTDDSDCVWDMIHRGVFTEGDTCGEIQLGIERILSSALGESVVNELAEKHAAGRTFTLDEEQLPIFNKGLFCAVIGKSRTATTINSIYRSNTYIIDPVAALTYSGLQDYRSKTGENRLTLLLSETSPLHHTSAISDATGLSSDAIQLLIHSAGQGSN